MMHDAPGGAVREIVIEKNTPEKVDFWENLAKTGSVSPETYSGIGYIIGESRSVVLLEKVVVADLSG